MLGFVTPNWAAAARAKACAVSPTESLTTWMVGSGVVFSCTMNSPCMGVLLADGVLRVRKRAADRIGHRP